MAYGMAWHGMAYSMFLADLLCMACAMLLGVAQECDLMRCVSGAGVEPEGAQEHCGGVGRQQGMQADRACVMN